MRLSPLLLSVFVTACSPAPQAAADANDLSAAATVAAFAPAKQEPVALDDESRFLVLRHSTASGVNLQVVRVSAKVVTPIAEKSLPWPAGMQFGKGLDNGSGEPRIEGAVSGNELLLHVSWEDGDTANANRTVLRLTDLEPLQPPQTSSRAFVTASIGCKSGWLVGGLTWEQEDDSWLSHLTVDLVPARDSKLHATNLWRLWFPRHGYYFHNKEIDAFCRSSRHVWAIDDVVSPKWALRLRELPNGRFGDVESFALPSGANERYFLAACHGEDLVLCSRWVTQGSEGQRVRLLQVDGTILQQTKTWSEYVPRFGRSGDYELDHTRASLLAGSPYTAWQGLCIVGNTAVVAAGQRGLLLFDLEHLDKSPGRFELGADVVDLHQVDGRTFVLLAHQSRSTMGELLLEDDGNATVVHLLEVNSAARFMD